MSQPNNALLRTSHKVRRPENADVRQKMTMKLAPCILTLLIALPLSGCAQPSSREMRDYRARSALFKQITEILDGLAAAGTGFPTNIEAIAIGNLPKGARMEMLQTFHYYSDGKVCHLSAPMPPYEMFWTYSKTNNRVEQAVPGYPPQGVGSPEPGRSAPENIGLIACCHNAHIVICSHHETIRLE